MNRFWYYVWLAGWIGGALATHEITFPDKVYGQESGDQVVAAGKGFSLSTMEVDQITDLLSQSSSQKPPRKQAEIMALSYKLMAHDLEIETPGAKATGKTPQEILEKAQLYIQKILDNYPVSDEVIESYYWSNPERYRPQEGSTGGLTPETRESIRMKIVEKKRKIILDQAVENLKKKYQVTVKGNP